MLDVRQSRELQAAILALSTAEREIKRDINRDAKSAALPVWTSALNSHARTRATQVVLAAGPRVTVGDRRVRVTAATKRRPLAGGLVPTEQWQGFEYGMRPRRTTVHARSKRGRAFTYERVQGRQFTGRTRKGQVAMRAAGDVGPAVVASWLRVIVGHFAAAYEVRR